MMTTEAPERMTNANGKNRWFQLGLVSAGAAAPLIARWRNLRAAEQAEALRAQAAERWNDTLAWIAETRPQEALQETLQETLRQAGPQAQESFRQVSAAAREALRRLPTSSATAPATAEPLAQPAPTHKRVNATLWAIGVGVGLVAAGAVAYIALRNRIGAGSDDDTLIEIPLTDTTTADTLAQEDAAAAAAMASEGPAIVEEPLAEEPGVAEPMPFSEDDAEGAAYVGNILSRVYHSVGSKHLPAPQHRIYFATQEEADAAGYRPDSAELASRGSDNTHGPRE